jgi:uncharacterized membrane protein YkvA (DUF1232 family)
MDKELDDFFQTYEMPENPDERRYQSNARIVSEQFEEKIESVGKKLRFAQDVIALYRYFSDSSVAWQKKVIIVAALVYFISPIDAIPDLVPFAGYLDDFGVILAVTKFMQTELEPYYSTRTA